MTIVRCPYCRAVFTLRPQELRAHAGVVGCALCRTPFHALDHIADRDVGPAAEESPQPQARQTSKAPAQGTTYGTDDAPERSAEATTFDRLADRLTPGTAQRTPRRASEWAALPVPPPRAPQQTRQAPGLGINDQAANRDARAAPAPRAPRTVAPASATPSPAASSPAMELPATTSAPAPRRGLLPPPGPTTRSPRGLAVGVLVVTLAAQSVFLFHDEIAVGFPLLRPGRLAACAQGSCDDRHPRIIGAIRIAESRLEADPANPVGFTLHLRIRNHARIPQAHPHLELTLTDANEDPLVRRVLLPSEWVDQDRLDTGFIAGEEIAIQLPFELNGVPQAAGYRVYAFFP